MNAWPGCEASSPWAPVFVLSHSYVCSSIHAASCPIDNLKECNICTIFCGMLMKFTKLAQCYTRYLWKLYSNIWLIFSTTFDIYIYVHCSVCTMSHEMLVECTPSSDLFLQYSEECCEAHSSCEVFLKYQTPFQHNTGFMTLDLV